MEADGLPAQLAPRFRPAVPDEPLEPWSPNYGTVKPAARATGWPAAQLDIAAVPAPSPALKIIPRPVDPDDIVRRAIAEHEMRQR
jgi:hypothetical protein